MCRCLNLFPDTVTVVDVFGSDSYTNSYLNSSNYTTFDYPASCDALKATYGDIACENSANGGLGEFCKRKSKT